MNAAELLEHLEMVANLSDEPDSPERQARELIHKLIKALAFYADPETYFAIGFFPDRPCGAFQTDFGMNYDAPFFDRPMPGKRARDVLRSLE